MEFSIIDLLGERSDRYREGYWEDARNEAGKVFDVSSLDTADEIISQLESDSSLNAIYSMVDDLVGDVPLGRVLSVASGTGWLEARLCKTRGLEELALTEISRHRLLDLAPVVLAAYGVPKSDVTLVITDFDSVAELNGKFDTILMSQALHHTEAPGRLLCDLASLLAPGGRVIVAGEHYFRFGVKLRALVGHFGKYLIGYRGYRKENSFVPCYSALFPPDREKGDFHFSKSHYFQVFRVAGFQAERFLDRSSGRQGFLLTKRDDGE